MKANGGRRSCFTLLIFLALHTKIESGTPKVGGPEHRLYTDLFSDYTSEARPVKNASHTVVVNFALSLNQLLDLDEKNQVLTTSVWIYEEWRDEMLTWSPNKYDGQRAIMIPADTIWLPDIFIFNTAGANMDGFVNVNGSKVAVQHDGSVRWMVPLMVASVCAVDVTYFPYDRQTCSIKFGSWIYDIEQLDIIIEATEPDLEHYVMNSEYDLKNVSIARGVLDSSCCPGDGRHSMVELTVELRRKSLYYDYIVIAPTIMLCVLTLASFLLPCDRGEKMAIGLTVFLTLYVLQLRIADNVPDTNSTPILGVFMLIVMTFNCVSLIMATIVMNIKKRGDDCPCPEVPSWLFWLSHHILGRVVCTSYLWKDEIQFPVSPQSHQPQSANQAEETTQADSDRTEAGSGGNREGTSTESVSGPKAQTSSTEKQNQLDSRKNGAKGTAVGKKRSNSTEDQNKKGKSNDLRVPLNPSNLPGPERGCYDPHKTPRPQSEGDTEMRLRKNMPQQGDNITTDSTQGGENRGQGNVSPVNESGKTAPEGNKTGEGFIRKRRWFYVSEVVDKFLFLVYLVLLTSSIFTVLFLIPVYFRTDN